MDAAALFNERRADVAAFAALLFQHRPQRKTMQEEENEKDSHTRRVKLARRKKPSVAARSEASAATPLRRSSAQSSATPFYRRPASANVPVSRVVQEAKTRAARRRHMAQRDATKLKSSTIGGARDGSTKAETPSSSIAMGFTAQELRDRTYLWMSEQGHNLDSSADVAREASKQRGVLTPGQQAQLRRLNIKRKHQRGLSHAQWVLLLRRRRRLWQRRRPVSRRRHLRRQLALQHGRLLSPCSCCRRSNKLRRIGAQKAPAKGIKARPTRCAARITQWLPSHARLVKRFHHRTLSLLLPRNVTHVKASVVCTAQRASAARGIAASTTSSQLKRRRAVLTARVSVPQEPKRKGHRFLQRWATELGTQQRRLHRASAASSPSSGKEERLHGSTALDTTLIADVSQQCVYAITTATSRGSASSVSLDADAVARVMGLRRAPGTSAEASATSGAVFSLAPTAQRQRTRSTAAAVVHGHMWGVTEDARSVASTRCELTDKRRGRVSTLARHTRVVPVVLVAYADRGTSGASLSDTFLLFSEAPVLIPRRASDVLQVQLISAWNPCCRCPALASVYEYWHWAPMNPQTNPSFPSSAESVPPASLSSPSPLEGHCAVDAVKKVLQRTARVYRRLQRRATTTQQRRCPAKNKMTSKAATNVASTAQQASQKKDKVARTGAVATTRVASSRARRLPRLSLVVFPSLPQPFLHAATEGKDQASVCKGDVPYVWRLGFVYHPNPHRQRAITRAQRSDPVLKDHATRLVRSASPRQLYRTSVRTRRAHFHLARRFFGFLLTGPFHPPSGPKPTTAAARTRVLGLSDRAALLGLVGRPVYPLDYGQSRPSAASQQRFRKSHRPTPRKSLVARPSAKRARDSPSIEGEALSSVAWHPLTSLPSYVHILEYYGNVTNAGCRLTVRSAHVDKKLPMLHSAVGSVLLRCRRAAVPKTNTLKATVGFCLSSSTPGAAGDSSPVVEQVGVVSSSAFFAQRFGCVVAPVWCCFPPCSASLEEAAPRPIASLAEHRDDCWTPASLLPSQQQPQQRHADVRYVLTTPEGAEALLRLSASLQRVCPTRKRSSSRRQRTLDLVRGRSARELEALLCDSTFCSLVQLIQWYA